MPRKPENEVGLRVQVIDHVPNTILRAIYETRKDMRNLRLHDWKKDAALPPRTLHFNVTDRCNALCSFCAYRLHKPEGIMPIEVFEKALKEFIALGGRSIGFNPLVGEPLLDPMLFDRIQMAKGLGVGHIFLYTNGIALNREGAAEKLLTSGLDEINLSIYAFSPTAFRKVMGVDKYDDFINGIIKLLTAKSRTESQVKLFMHMRGRSKDFFTEDFRERVLPLVDSDFMRNNVFFPRLYDNWVDQIGKADLPEGSDFYPRGAIRRRPCDRTFELAVLTNGDVRACDCRFGKGGRHDALVIGNINTARLEDMWKGARLAKLRESFRKGSSPSVCRECNDYNPR